MELCERCNEYREDYQVHRVPFQDRAGSWRICDYCIDEVKEQGEESPVPFGVEP